MPLSDFSVTTSEGVIADTPASCFRYKYVLDIELPVPSGIGPTLTIVNGTWRLRVVTMTVEQAAENIGLGAKQASGTLSADEWEQVRLEQSIFEQEVTLQYSLVTTIGFDFYGLPLLTLFTWYFNDSAQEIKTTICGDRMATAETAEYVSNTDTHVVLRNIEGVFPASGGAYIGTERIVYESSTDDTLADITTRAEYGGRTSWPVGTEVRQAPPTIGHEVGYATDDAAESSYTNWALRLMGEFVGPIYQLDVPAGAQIVIDFHNVGLTKLSLSVAAVQTQVCQANIAGIRDPYQGVSWAVLSGDDGPQLDSIHDNNTQGPFAAALPGIGHSTLIRHPHSTRLGVIADYGGGIGYTESTAEGQEGTWTDMAVIIADVDLITACLSEDGGMAFIIGRDGGQKVYHALRDADGSFVAVGDPLIPTGLGSVEPGSFMQDAFGALHIVSQSGEGIVHYTSTDGGATWQ